MLTQRGIELREDDQHEDAIETFRAAMALGERSAPRELAYALMGTERPREALKVVKRAIKTGRVDLYSLLGLLAVKLGEVKLADRSYRKAIESGDLSALNDYGSFLGDEGRFEEAIATLLRSAEFGDVLAPGNLISIYVEDLDDLDSALQAGLKYLDPTRLTVYPALAEVYAHLDRLDDAEDLFRQGIELQAPRVHQRYGEFLRRYRQDFVAAERELWAAFDNDESGWSRVLGSFLVERGRTDEARAVLERGAAWGDLDAQEMLLDLGAPGSTPR